MSPPRRSSCSLSRGKIDETDRLVATLGVLLSYPRFFGFLPIICDWKERRFRATNSKLYLMRYYLMVFCSCGYPIIIGLTYVINHDNRTNPNYVVHYNVFFPISLYAVVNAIITVWKRHQVVAILNTFILFYKRFQQKSEMLKNEKSVRISHSILNVFLLGNVTSMLWATVVIALYILIHCPIHLLSPALPICGIKGFAYSTPSVGPIMLLMLIAILMVVQFLIATMFAATTCINYVFLFILFGSYHSAAQLRRLATENEMNFDWMDAFTQLELVGIHINSVYSFWISQIVFWVTILTVMLNLMTIHFPVGRVLTVMGASLAFSCFSFAILIVAISANMRVAMKQALWRHRTKTILTETLLTKVLRARRGIGISVGQFTTIDKTSVTEFAHVNVDLTISALVAFSATK